MNEAGRQSQAPAHRRGGRVRGLPILAVLIFLFSVLPPVFMLLPRTIDAEPVDERRTLAPPPGHWQGTVLNFDGNFHVAEKWFDDHLGLRNFMIRAKNEVDYRLFGTSGRVYFGHHGQIFSRSIIDLEVPASEHMLGTPGKLDAIHHGILKLTDRLQSEGITPIYIFPYMKQYFYQSDLPLIAPRLKFPTHFQELNQRLLADPRLHVIDTYTPMLPANVPYPTYLLEDFHWTDASAFTIAREVVGEISKLEGRPRNIWSHELVVTQQKRVGSEARFSARLFKSPTYESAIKLTYQKRPEIELDPKTTGMEYETNMVHDATLLPPTCLFGNSFGDVMTLAGMPVYFQQFIQLDRLSLIVNVPPRINGRCKYLVVQILDIQPHLLNSFSQLQPDP